MIEPWKMSDTELATAMAEREQQVRLLQAEQHALLAEAHSRGATSWGYSSIDTWQMDLLRISRTEAGRRSTRAKALHPTRDGSAMVAAVAPLVAEAAADGVLDVEHIDVVVKTLHLVPQVVGAEERTGYETTLVELARTVDPARVRTAGRHIIRLLEQETAPQAERDQLARPRRELRTGWLRNGRFTFTGELDPEAGALFETMLSPLSKPRPAENGERDPRTRAERQGDALAEILHLTQRAAELPMEAGHRPTVMVTMTLESLTQALRERGWPTEINGVPVTAEQARQLACEAGIIPAVLGSQGEVLDLGRKVRLATPEQRQALVLRDKGCVKCGRPPQWCIAHHIIHWLDNGLTDIDNLCLLCTECHRIIHHSDWRIEMRNRQPVLIPPAWIPRC